MAGGRARWVAALAALLAAGAGAGLILLLSEDNEPDWSAASGSVFAEGACRQMLAADLGFSRLPPVREPRFALGASGPRSRPVIRGLDGRLVAPGEPYGLAVQGPARQPAMRDWRVTARMLALDDHGAVGEEVSRDRLEQTAGEWMSYAKLQMRVGEEPGYYLVELLVSGAGRHSGQYGFYLKAEPPHAETRLGISGRRFRPGGRVKIRVENLGTETITYGLPFDLDRKVGGGWEQVPLDVVWPLPLLATQGGEAGECQAHVLSPDLDPGRYRFAKEVSTESPSSPKRVITAEFEVTG